MTIEQTLGTVGQRLHHGVEALERSLEKPRILLDRLAQNLDWVKQIPSIALRTTLVLAAVYMVATLPNHVAAGNFNSVGQDQADGKTHPALIVNSNIHADGLSHDIAAGAAPNPPREIFPPGLSPNVQSAISHEFGHVEISTWNNLIDSMLKSDVINMGDSHSGTREISLAKQTIQALMNVPDGRPIAFATERFFATPEQQAALDNLNTIQNLSERQAALEKILNSPMYIHSWGLWDGFSMAKNPENVDAFNDMLGWLVRNNIPIIALDSPLADQEKHLLDGQRMGIRNQSWANHQADFLTRHPNFRVVAFGGADHFTQEPSVSTILVENMGDGLTILTIGMGASGDDLTAISQYTNATQKPLVISRPEFVGLISNETGARKSGKADFWLF